jgi:hypothetical protein
MPVRIQRKRSKGWKMPENTVYVGRPGPHGNPHDWRDYRDNFPKEYAADLDRDQWCRGMAVGAFEEDIRDGLIKPDISSLRGKNLACWCKVGDRCHADVLLELANQG